MVSAKTAAYKIKAADRRAASAERAAARAKGVLISPRIMHAKATTLKTLNSPNILSFSKKRAAQVAGRIHGFTAVNSPGAGRRSTAGAKPSGHGINAPRGQW